MEIIYADGAIVDVRVSDARLQTKMTTEEKVRNFGCTIPNLTVVTYLHSLERQVVLEGDQAPKTASDVVDAIVADGGMTSQRGAEIKAD